MDFHELYRRYAPALRRFALFLSGDATLADDIASETLVRAWVARDRIVQSTVKAYLFAIARNCFRDHQRERRRWEPLQDSPEPVTFEAKLHDRFALRSVLASIQQLPELDRAALLMRAQDGMSYLEIAQVLDISVPNAKVRVHRARLRLMEAREPLSAPKMPREEKS